MKASEFREWLEKISQLSCGQKEQVRQCLSEVAPQAAVVKWLEDSFEPTCPACQADHPYRWGHHKRGCNVFAVACASTRSRPYREPLWPVCGIRNSG